MATFYDASYIFKEVGLLDRIHTGPLQSWVTMLQSWVGDSFFSDFLWNLVIFKKNYRFESVHWFIEIQLEIQINLNSVLYGLL